MPHIPIGFDITELIGSILLGALSFCILGLFHDIQMTSIITKKTEIFFLLVSFFVTRASVKLFIIFIQINYDYFNTALFIPIATYLQDNDYELLLNIFNFYLQSI